MRRGRIAAGRTGRWKGIAAGPKFAIESPNRHVKIRTVAIGSVKRAKIMLNGSVQGVGLRASIWEYADKLGPVGQARNIENNGVEVTC